MVLFTTMQWPQTNCLGGHGAIWERWWGAGRHAKETVWNWHSWSARDSSKSRMGYTKSMGACGSHSVLKWSNGNELMGHFVIFSIPAKMVCLWLSEFTPGDVLCKFIACIVSIQTVWLTVPKLGAIREFVGPVTALLSHGSNAHSVFIHVYVFSTRQRAAFE